MTDDLVGAMAIRRRKHDLGPPDELALGIAVGEQSLKLRTVIGVQIQANVIASHSPTMTRLNQIGNHVSSGEY